MGYKYDADALLAQACDLVLAEGLSALNYGTLARRIGLADRVLVYYFPTKIELQARAVQRISEQLMEAMERAFDEQVLTRGQLLDQAWKVLSAPEVSGPIGVFFEVLGLASGGSREMQQISARLVDAWVEWLEPLAGSRAAAVDLVSRIDGLLIVQRTLGDDAARLVSEQWAGA